MAAHAGGPLVVPGAPGAGRPAARRAASPAGGVALDVGCGTGEVVDLAAPTSGRAAPPAPISPTTCSTTPTATGAPATAPSSPPRPSSCPSPAGSADVLTSLEVVEHLDDDLGALARVPPGAATGRDPARHRARPTSGCGATRTTWPATAAATAPAAASSTSSVPPGSRWSGRATTSSSWCPRPSSSARRRCGGSCDDNGETSSSGRAVTAVMERLCRAEQAWMRRGWPVPFGLSIWVLARRR